MTDKKQIAEIKFLLLFALLLAACYCSFAQTVNKESIGNSFRLIIAGNNCNGDRGGTTEINYCLISKKDLLSDSTIHLPDSSLKILSFKVSIVRVGATSPMLDIPCTGNILSSSVMQEIRMAHTDDKIYFEAIRAIGADGKIRLGDAVSVKLTD